jgi:hypothetical protein
VRTQSGHSLSAARIGSFPASARPENGANYGRRCAIPWICWFVILLRLAATAGATTRVVVRFACFRLQNDFDVRDATYAFGVQLLAAVSCSCSRCILNGFDRGCPLPNGINYTAASDSLAETDQLIHFHHHSAFREHAVTPPNTIPNRESNHNCFDGERTLNR